MPLEPVVSEFADFCPVCEEMAVLRWSDSDLEERICEDCAKSLGYAEHALLKIGLDHPSPGLIQLNP
jgi:hypothetical protein